MTSNPSVETPGSDEPGVPGVPRRPGEWPFGTRRPHAVPAAWLAAVEHRHQFHAVLNAARELIESEPSPQSQRALAARISRAVLALADDTAQQHGAHPK